jgi:indole-3-glycerol phosphate synthase
MDILQEICEYTRGRVEINKKLLPFEEVKRQAIYFADEDKKSKKGGQYAFENALKGDGLSLICEVKKASPSKGIIDDKFDYMSIARDYEEGGADCISCLTEPKWFLGSDEIFKRIRNAVKLPMLRKDFIVDAYQAYQSKILGANAILIIMTASTFDFAKELFEIAESLGMSALFECRNEEQIENAQRIGARLIGVNNRNLKDFSVDLGKANSLKKYIDGDKIFVSESGIASLDDLKKQKLLGADACLVGEFCMRAKDRRKLIAQMKNV